MSLQQVAAKADATSGNRTTLTGVNTIYVRSDGSDSNAGLVNTAAGAFLTLQSAYDSLCSTYDTSGFTTTIQGTTGVNAFTAGLYMQKTWIGGGALVIDLGAGGSITMAVSVAPIRVGCTLPASCTIQNMTLSGSVATIAVQHDGVGALTIGAGITFGGVTTSGYHMSASTGAIIKCPSSYTISGDCGIHAYAATAGVVDLYAGAFGTTTTISANITVGSAFIYCDPNGTAQAIASARTIALGGHTVTGTRYTVVAGGVINTQGGGANYFPGTVAGGGAGTYL